MASDTILLAAVGDLMLGDSPTCPGFGFANRIRPDSVANPFDEVSELLDGDIVLGNLETTLSQHGLRQDDWRSVQMRGLPCQARLLAEAGFTVLNVANNHSVQHGERAFRETVELLRESGIEVCGLKGTDGWHSRPVIQRTDQEKSIGVLGYSLRPEQYASGPLPYASGSEAAVINDTRRLADAVDTVVVTLHWGDEFVRRPSRDQAELARSLAEAGAAIIVGHHPHVLQPIERFEDSVLAYSLGNFLTDMLWQKRLRRGAVLRCRAAGRTVTELETHATHITDDGCVELSREGSLPEIVQEPNVSLAESEYRSAVLRSVRSQRFAAYRYALANLDRYRPRMLLQLGTATLGNKLGFPLR